MAHSSRGDPPAATRLNSKRLVAACKTKSELTVLEMLGTSAGRSAAENYRDEATGNTVLHWAAKEGLAKAVKQMLDLKTGKERLAEVRNEDGKTPRQLAEEAGHYAVVVVMNVFHGDVSGRPAKETETASSVSGKGTPHNCGICLAEFSTFDDCWMPVIVCANGHTYCKACAVQLFTCPTCQEESLPAPIVNRVLCELLERAGANKKRPPEVREIPAGELVLVKENFVANGVLANISLFKWGQKEVAVKFPVVLSPTAGEAKVVKEQVGLAMGLVHPNILRVFGILSKIDKMGIVMECADLGSIAERASYLSQGKKAAVALDACRALRHMHRRSMVHGNLNPRNILLFMADNRFGMTAKLSDIGMSQVEVRGVVKSPYYLAPEAAKDKRQACTVAADIYSLSLIVYELFSGREAFPDCANVWELFQKVVVDRRRPDVATRDIPAALGNLLKLGWDHDPQRRRGVEWFQAVLSSRPFFPT